MSIILQYSPEKKVLYITVLDELNLSEFADKLEEITHSDDYPSDAGILLDASSINMPFGNRQFDLDLIEIRKKFIEMEKAKIAIITSSDFTFGISGKYEKLPDTAPQNIMVFNDFIKGEEWLAGTGK